jgi:hypothetical protein
MNTTARSYYLCPLAAGEDNVTLSSLLRITAVGEYVECSLRELRLILFSDAVPDDIANYCPDGGNP